MSAGRRILPLAIVAVAAATGAAQDTSGSIAGFVTDGRRGLPGVTVRATHVSTAYARQAVTSAHGYYVLALLPPGRYDVTFALGGGAPSAVRGVDLHVSDRLIVNAVAGATPVERQWGSGERAVQPGPAFRQVVTARQVEALPLIDRLSAPLAAPIGGVPPPGAGFFLDGASILDTASAGLLLAPSLESIEEVRIIAGLPGATWPGGAVVSLVTKSGTNALRGSVYEHHRNDALDANSFLRNSSLDPALRAGPPRLRQDIFGYTAGGPIRKDALFIFLAQEWRRRRGELPVDAIDARQDTARVDHLSSRLRVLGRYTRDAVDGAGRRATGHVLVLQAGAALLDTTRNQLSYRMTDGAAGTTHVVADDLSFQRGTHTVKIGGLVAHESTRDRHEAYAQDWWRVRRGVTVDLGARYAERSLGPRLGISWVPGEGTATVLRGGFAVHHAPRPIRQWTVGIARTLYDRGTIDVAYAGSREETDPARTRYHGLRATFRHEGREGLADLSYALSRTRPAADRTHVFTASWVRDLGRWRISGITTFQSGPPAAVRVGDDGPPAGQVSDPFQNLPSDRYYFSPAAFAPPTAGAPPSPLRLPGRNQWDVAVSREIPLRARARVRLRADVFNLFNHTQFSDVDTRCTARPGDTTCAVPNTTFGQYTAARPPREVQVGLRLSWN